MRSIIWYNNHFDSVSWFFNPVSAPDFPAIKGVDSHIEESPHAYLWYLDLPGWRKKDFNIKVDNGFILVEGMKKENFGKSWKFWKKHHLGRQEYSFVESKPLYEDMDVDRIHAKMRNGILTIEIPKKEEFVNYREIPVSGDDGIENAEVVEEENKKWIRNAKTRFLNWLGKAA